jgi:hypothetical protein
MQQAARVSQYTGFLTIPEPGTPGRLIEMDRSEFIFSTPPRTPSRDSSDDRRISHRRAGPRNSTDRNDDVIRVQDIELDRGARRLRVRGKLFELPRKEFELMESPMLNTGQRQGQEILLNSLWGNLFRGDEKPSMFTSDGCRNI